MPAELQWQDTPPTVPGWWFLRPRGGKERAVLVVHLWGCLRLDDNERRVEAIVGAEWAGPILPPADDAGKPVTPARLEAMGFERFDPRDPNHVGVRWNGDTNCLRCDGGVWLYREELEVVSIPPPATMGDVRELLRLLGWRKA